MIWLLYACLKSCFPDERKKNVVPAHKQLQNNLTQNNLILPNHSVIKTGDLCINQLISITREINKPFDNGFEVGSVFLDILDISKAFDKVWYLGLHYILKQNGISTKRLNTLTDLLDNRTQTVILNDQYFLWAIVEIGVP